MRVFVWLLPLSLLVSSFAALAEDVPSPDGRRVVDAAGVLSPAGTTALAEEIGALDRETGVELGILTMPKLERDNPKEFATKVFKSWGVGKKGQDNGLLILLCLDPRRIEIETGYGVEATIPDALAGRLIREKAKPELAAGHFGAGLLALTKAVGQTIRARKQELPPTSAGGKRGDLAIMSVVTTALHPFTDLVRSMLGSFWTWFVIIAFLMGGLKTKNRMKCATCGKKLGPGTDTVLRPVTATQDGELGLVRHCPEGHRAVTDTRPLPRVDQPRCLHCGAGWPAKQLTREVPATASSEGLKEWRRTCAACGYAAGWTDRLPRSMLSSSSGGSSSSGSSSSSSSGGDSFGGGSSGGGGAGDSF